MKGTERKKMLPVGIEHFEDIRQEGFYYVDKTVMVRDLLCKWSKVNLFTRPRRFGKSLNMSMLKSFFEIGSKKELFDGLKITEETDLCESYMGKFPVVSMSLKGANGVDFASARAMICSIIGHEAMRFQFLLDSDQLTDREKRLYEQLVTIDETNQSVFAMSDSTLSQSLKTLSELLQKHYKKKVILLIDEYDVPLAKADERGYYKEMVLLIRNLFEQALKTNESLQFAILTGCLQVAKESIFTGLNNLKVFSVTTVRFDEYFGFTDDEVREMLDYYGLEKYYNVIKEWYNGYRFGNTDVYCPWDVINYCDELTDDPNLEPRDYWSNTSGNDIIRHFMEHVDHGLAKSEMEALIAGETVEKEVREELTYSQLYDTIENIWSVLFMTGYLTCQGRPEGKRLLLRIPNREIRKLFVDQIMTMFKEETGKDGDMLERFCHALQSGNAEEAECLFTSYLGRTIGIRDTFVQKPLKENFYHGILIGILGLKNGWYVKSNRESGDGYSDILIRIEREGIGIIIEVKYAEYGAYDFVCQGALEQIERGGYAAELLEEGYDRILKYGIACYKKKCRIVLAGGSADRNSGVKNKQK